MRAITFLTTFLFCLLVSNELDATQQIKILVKDTTGPLKVSGKHLQLHSSVGTLIAEGKHFTLKPTSKGITIENGKDTFENVKITSNGLIEFLDRKFNKHLEAIFQNPNHLLLIHPADLEDYVAGTVASEVPEKWPLEALKAQAIATRTYAIFQKYKHVNDPFHVSSTVMDQVFEGAHKTHQNAFHASKKTEGKVVTYNHEVIKAFFHSTCGDKTTSAKSVWGGNIAYLPGSKCGYCKTATHHTWKYSISKSKLSDALKPLIKDRVKSLKITKKDETGRALQIKITGARRTHYVSGNDFRKHIGYTELRSSWITSINNRRGTYTFSGRGYGHGVGMCQWGAYGMAKKNYTAQNILAHYYPGTKVLQMY